MGGIYQNSREISPAEKTKYYTADFDVSIRTKTLKKQKSKMKRKTHTKNKFKGIQEKIRKSCLQDYEEWVIKNVKEMETANAKGDVRLIYQLLNIYKVIKLN